MSDLLPFTIVTGYLGSGKTTLLNRLLRDQRFRNSLVIINELADLALDGMRLTETDIDYVVLGNGCVCCTTSADLTSTVSRAVFRRSHGLLPPFERFILETTGAADPYALIAAFGNRGTLSHLCHLELVITTVDGLLGEVQLDEHGEVQSAVQAADHLVVTKTDLATERPERLLDRLTELNPLATISLGPSEVDLVALMSAGLRDAETGEANWQRWLRLKRPAVIQEQAAPAPTPLSARASSRPALHTPNVRALTIVLERRVDFRAWCQWVAQYVQQYGKRVLRLKAILVTDRFDGPIAFDTVREIIHAPVELAPSAVPDHRSRVVLLCQDIAPLELQLLEAAVHATQVA